MIIDPNDLIPPNSGTWRAVDVVAPEGSVVNILPPAPVVYANHEMTPHRIRSRLTPSFRHPPFPARSTS